MIPQPLASPPALRFIRSRFSAFRFPVRALASSRRVRLGRWIACAGVLVLALLLSGCAWRGIPPQARVHGWRTVPLAESRLVAQEPRPVSFLHDIAAEAAARAIREESKGHVAPGEIYVTVIDARDPHDPRMGSYRGAEDVYPASVVKTCYLVAAYDWNRTGRLDLDDDLRHDLRLMIGPSDNQATNRVLDRLTGTGFGDELEGRAWDSFAHKRRHVARYFQELGLPGLWASNHTFDSGIRLYGRDLQWLGPRTPDHFKNSNAMTTDDTARLLYLIWRRSVVDPAACDEMLDILHRKPNPQSAYFPGVGIEGLTLYSKGGYTSIEQHDAGIFALDDERAVIVVVFTIYRGAPSGTRLRVVPRAAELILESILAEPGVLDPAAE